MKTPAILAQPASQAFELTFSPAHDAAGKPFNPRASRQELAFRLYHIETAPTAEAAAAAFEQREDRMVTACKRVQTDPHEAWA